MSAAARGILASTIFLTTLILLAPPIAETQDVGSDVHQRSFEAQYPVQAVYPPLARAARITGDVRIRVSIRPDGNVISAEVIDGPPMLRDAALASAKQSRFFCWPECTDDVTTAIITYTYGTRQRDLDCWANVRVRSWKCLNLWKCRVKNMVPIPSQPTTIGILPNRILILADPGCIETERADSNKLRASR